MLSGFKTRKPWAAAIIGFVVGPVAGMLYLNRGWIALYYVTLLLSLMAAAFAAAHFQILTADPREAVSILSWGVQVVGAAHCFWLARKRGEETLQWYSRWYSILFLCLVLPMAAAVVFHHNFYETFHTASISMEPTLNPEDYFFVDKRAYVTQPPRRGDVVVFKVSLKEGVVEYVKRIIGMPGEKIQLKNGTVYINDKPLPRRILGGKDDGPLLEIGETLPEGREIVILRDKDKNSPNNVEVDDENIVYNVPADEYFVMGDYPSHSSDSSNALGNIGRRFITGKAGAVFWNDKTYRFSYRRIE